MGNTIYKYSERLGHFMYAEIDKITRQCIAMHDNPDDKFLGENSFILSTPQAVDRVTWFYDFDEWFSPDTEYAKDVSNRLNVDNVKYIYRKPTNVFSTSDTRDDNEFQCDKCPVLDKISEVAKNVYNSEPGMCSMNSGSYLSKLFIALININK